MELIRCGSVLTVGNIRISSKLMILESGSLDTVILSPLLLLSVLNVV